MKDWPQLVTSVNCNPSSACWKPAQKSQTPYFADGFKWVRKHVRLQYFGKHSASTERSNPGRKGKLSADCRGAQIQDQMTAVNPFVHYRMNLWIQIVSKIKTKVFQYLESYKHSRSYCTCQALKRSSHWHGQGFINGYDGNGIARGVNWAKGLSTSNAGKQSNDIHSALMWVIKKVHFYHVQ